SCGRDSTRRALRGEAGQERRSLGLRRYSECAGHQSLHTAERSCSQAARQSDHQECEEIAWMEILQSNTRSSPAGFAEINNPNSSLRPLRSLRLCGNVL